MSKQLFGRGGSLARGNVWALVAPYSGPIVLLGLVSLAGAMLEAVFLVSVTGVAMALVNGTDTVGPVLGHTLRLGPALGASALMLLARLICNLGAVQISTDLTARVTVAQREKLAHAYIRSSWAVQQGEPAGRLQALLTGVVGAATNTVSTLTTVVSSLLSLVAFLGTGIAIDPLTAIAALAALVLVGALLTPIRSRIRANSVNLAQSGMSFARAVSELGSLGLEMQTFGVQDNFIAHIDELTAESVALQRRVGRLSGAMSPLYTSLAYGALLGGVAVLTGVEFERIAVIGALMLLMLRALGYGQTLAAAAVALAANSASLDMLRTNYERYANQPASGGTAVPEHAAPLVGTDISFAYQPDRPALADVSFQIEKGEAVGIIGPSGAGKSTLAQLLLGLREPDTGVITAGGVDLREIDRGWWTSRVCLVAQDALLITGTVAENIRFFRPNISDDDLVAAARRAHLLADIEALPEGFATFLGERGAGLSGGQRQRLSIARALAGRPEILVLDEPTSALDGASEAAIRDTLIGLAGSVTLVLIAHRMSTLEVCERIMVVQGGRITGFDRPEALIANNDFYRRAVELAKLRVDID